jgi:superfamily II DNA or RNA helicase
MPELKNPPGSDGPSRPRYVTYFGKHYDDLRLPLEKDGQPGLRRGQAGALHAIAAHFTFKTDAAIVTMPTGSGKTVVLAVSPFILRANRVLVITPSRLVRDQITDEFATLSRVISTGALPRSVLLPRVIEIKKKLSTEGAWDDLVSYHVVVGTPNCVSPALSDVATPPEDFFDLILFDEAHHSPARTWDEILKAFPAARKLLVTATPFRRDRKEIKGAFVFDYPVRQAYKDGVFGHIEFQPVEDHGLDQNDVEIAQTAERILIADRKAGLDHFVMVRTDLKTRAQKLEQIYREKTSLKLRRIDSSRSLKYLRTAIEALKGKELDGIIAVDMLGEGFDFPNLKIAAVHSPHKSLAATLQFVGRFARTGVPNIGQAKFVAVTQEIKGELRELWDEGSEWHEIIPMLNDERVQDELEIRAALSNFRQDENVAVDDETEDLSLYSIRPYSHVKVYRVAKDLDITTEIDLVRGLELRHREVSNDGNTVILITKEETQPKWASPGRFRKIEYDLFIIHIERDFGLVFICTSRRRELVYRQMIDQLTGTAHDILAVDVINRVLNDIENAEAFSVGMRNRMQGATESYRIMAGPKADKAIKPTDGRMYHRGHAMFRGRQGGADVTIGLSSASKVWSNSYLQIPHLLQWCHKIALKLADEGVTKTNSNWDLLPMPKRISTLPSTPAISVDWDAEVYLTPPTMLVAAGGSIQHVSLLDADIEVDRKQDSNLIRFRVNYDKNEWAFQFALTPAPTITPDGWSEDNGPTVDWEGDEISLVEFLTVSPPTFYFPDFSSLSGRNYLEAVTAGMFFESDRIEIVDWTGLNVDIQAERYKPKAGLISIHAYLIQKLGGESHSVVVYDDGTGEVADFVAIDEGDTHVRFTLYHAKRSHGPKPGERLADVYEVCGQAVKSIRWTLSAEGLVARLLSRSKDREAESIVRGSRKDLKNLSDSVIHKRVSFEIVIVQPGISRASLTPDNIALPLASADLFIRESGAFEDLRVWGSA